jgi:CheY-like chemotaxis protein
VLRYRHRPRTRQDDPAVGTSSEKNLGFPKNVASADHEVLLLAGHEVRTVNDGHGAILAVKEFRPEVVLLDLGMPGMDGYEVARRLRAEDALRGLVLVALSGWSQPHDRRRTQEVGFDYHLTKPANPAALNRMFAALRSP